MTGAGGFIGSRVTRHLVGLGHDVRAVLRTSSSGRSLDSLGGPIERVTADLFGADSSSLAKLAQGVDACIHLAWYAVPGQYLAAPENLACMSGSLRLLEALAAAGCRRAVFVGSCFEYDFEPGWLHEDGPVRPQSLYAAAKLSTRLLGEQAARLHSIEFTWARLFYLYGPGEDPRRLVPQVIHSLLRGEPVQLTRGVQVRDFLHVDDVASALVTLASSDVTGVVNVGSGQPVTVRQVVAELERIVEVQGLARFGTRPENPTDPPFICADSRRIASRGCTPRHDLGQGLLDTVDWWRAQLLAR